MFDIIFLILFSLLIISISGYIFALLAERDNLHNHSISIKSNTVTQSFLDGLDLKTFKLGKNNMIIGDEVKITTYDSLKIRGTILGAKRVTNQIFLLTSKDEVVELNVQTIKRLVITSKYGRFF